MPKFSQKKMTLNLSKFNQKDLSKASLLTIILIPEGHPAREIAPGKKITIILISYEPSFRNKEMSMVHVDI